VLKRFAVASALALGAVFAAAGVAHADDILVVGYDGVEEYYNTEAECRADGPNVHLEINDRRNCQYLWIGVFQATSVPAC